MFRPVMQKVFFAKIVNAYDWSVAHLEISLDYISKAAFSPAKVPEAEDQK